MNLPSVKIIQIFLLLLTLNLVDKVSAECQPCFYSQKNINCQIDELIPPTTLHMSVHPHLDAFWIYDFDTYYGNTKMDSQQIGYFQSNKFSTVRQIFDTALQVLLRSKIYKNSTSSKTQKARRAFFNSEIGFFKHWFIHLHKQKQNIVKQLLHQGRWQILGGGFVQHDEGCSYYEDIIENFEIGLHFLKEKLNYIPKIAISSDSFGHSQSTAAILAHLGIQGYFVERSDEHILQQKATQFIWRAKSSNNMVYGVMPTSIRWAIHGYEEMFTSFQSMQSQICQQKQQFFTDIRMENAFLKEVSASNHIMRYFGHDFQKFQSYQYEVIETLMEQLSKEKCQNVIALYTNPTEYFKILLNSFVSENTKIKARNSDIFPIWDFDSGLYWTGYFTTDPYHKKYFRDCGRLLHSSRKAFLLSYLEDSKSEASNLEFQVLSKFSELVSYLQHHDGISGTSKYAILDKYERKAQILVKQIEKKILGRTFSNYYGLYTSNPILTCGIFQQCKVPSKIKGNVYIKIFNSGSRIKTEPFVISLPEQTYYKADCQFETICMCQQQPCSCSLYLYPNTFTFTEVLLKRTQNPVKIYYMKQINKGHSQSMQSAVFSFNNTHVKLSNSEGFIQLGYKTVKAESSSRSYDHLNRFGGKSKRDFIITSGKYALGNNPERVSDFSQIKIVYVIQSPKLSKILILWRRQQMKTTIQTSYTVKGSWKVVTHAAPQAGQFQDIYIQFGSGIKNSNKFFTDSNGWLITERKLFERQGFKAYYSENGKDNINGNTYPMTAFSFIQDQKHRLSVNTDRPQGVISLKQGKIWVNIDRLTEDDGKWVYQTTYRSQIKKFTHFVTLDSKSKLEKEPSYRLHQINYDQPLLAQLNEIEPNNRYEIYQRSLQNRKVWTDETNIESTKFWVIPYNDSTTLLRIQNFNDNNSVKIGLFRSNQLTYLSSYFGIGISFDKIEQYSLGGNMKYEEFLQNKWVFEKPEILNFEEDNKIFEKIFGENIQLRPLEIRTFRLTNLKTKICNGLNDIPKNGLKIEFRLNKEIQASLQSRDIELASLEQQANNYLKNKDHCTQQSPILKKSKYKQTNINYNEIARLSGLKDDAFRKEEEQNLNSLKIIDPHQKKQVKYGVMDEIKKMKKTINIQIKKKEEKKMEKLVETNEIKGQKTQIMQQIGQGTPSILQIKKKLQAMKQLTKQQKHVYFGQKKILLQKYLAKMKKQ